MIYLRLKGQLADILAQLAYAEKISKQYNQEIVLYVNGSADNLKSYYEGVLKDSTFLHQYQFVETYPITEPVLYESSENFNEEVAARGAAGQDIVIEGDFYYLHELDYSDLKDKFEVSSELMEYMSGFGITENSLYIEAQPLLTRQKDEFALAGRLLEKQLSKFKNRTFDSVFVRTEWPEFFITAGFEEILGVNDINYIVPDDIPGQYREAAEVLFPYLCKSSIISNYVTSWWGHILNKKEGHEVGILFPYGKIKRVDNAPDGISNELITEAIMDIFYFGREEREKQRNGEPSAFDGVFFDDETITETTEPETNGEQ